MSLTFKLLSLVIRTAAKPIGNYIKRQAHEHEGFKRFAINQAQRVHRIDMRMRLGLLHDPEAQKRMHEREQKAAEDKKRKAEAPTVRTEEEQRKYDEQKAREGKAEKEGGGKKKKEEPARTKIRPLSDARAIELGANFFSETFIFLVAVGLLLAENYRSNRKASNRRDEVKERLDGLEQEVERLRNEHSLPELEALNERIKRTRAAKTSWWNPAGWWKRTEPDDSSDTESDAKDDKESRIPGNVPGPSPEEAVKSSKSPEVKFTDVKAIEPQSTSPPNQTNSSEARSKDT